MVPIYCNWCLQKNNTSAIQKSEKKRQKGTLDLHLPKKQVPAPRPISSLHPPAWNPRWWTPRDFWLRPGPGQTADSMILGSGEVEAFRKIITTSKWSEVTLTLATLDISVVIQHDSITISLNKKKLCFFMLPSQQGNSLVFQPATQPQPGGPPWMLKPWWKIHPEAWRFQVSQNW